MDGKPGSRIIQLSAKAHYDVAGIDNVTATLWGEVQAERYLAYLKETFSCLAQNPALGYPIQDRDGYFVYTAKFKKRRSAHGHRIFYQIIENGILIIRVMHTAMNWPQELT